MRKSSSQAAAAEASVFDLMSVPKHDAPCDSGKDRVRLVFPWRKEVESGKSGNQDINLRRYRFSATESALSYADWRSQLDRLNSADVFRNDRVTWAHN